MLVLSRGKSESVVIGNGEIEVHVVEIRGDKVRLGFKAHVSIPIHRSEVQQAIDRDTQQAAAAEPAEAANSEM